MYVIYYRVAECKHDQQSRLTLWCDLVKVMIHFFGLYILVTDFRLFTICLTYITHVCFCLLCIGSGWNDWEGLASRIWSPFYCRACFPKDYPPQREWTMITLEEPMGWEEKTYLVLVIYAVMRNGWTERQSLSWLWATPKSFTNILLYHSQLLERKFGMLKFSMCLLSKYSFNNSTNYCHWTICWRHWL